MRSSYVSPKWKRYMKNKLLICMAVSATFSMGMPNVALGASGENCPSQWREIVVEVEKMLNGASLRYPLVFIDRYGSVYDCMSIGVSLETLSVISAIEHSLPKDRTSIINENPATWPQGICVIGEGAWPMVRYYAVYLPIEAALLSNKKCLSPIFSGIKDIVSSLEK